MCLLLCFSFPVTSSAEVVSHNVFQPYYEKASEAKSELIINGTTATCESTLRGDPNVTKIVAVQTLEKQGFLWIWDTYDDTTWTKTVYSNTFTMTNTKTCLSGGNIDSKRFSRLRTSRARPRLLRFTAVRCRSIEQDGL